ncbi:5'/3'-nucleotidase SurE [Ehrlichia ruminantium]|uniref:5'-nucleotidase SurE n=1 Tax=Ehrlichia ruminantium TaxID=779 RepID=A0AAE6UKL6_EHRRU|nr:5'/3'-nucleotidase SurE [Ehrlichia ruminantium]QGR02379.1 5'/3'-nucleotidase SurE [Ehrlichia ruminantium]QGR03298.1 5'/3'-nucleotidase SurE [Ehrlichia ruminantium]QGR04224.1 5'/3'-nucleotidase SurE [Ehrlichia ruminantium]
MRVLLSNDDGFHANGIKTLKEIVIRSGIASEVWVVAPLNNCSGSGRSVGLNVETQVHQVSDTEFIVNSTPSTSVFLALMKIMDHKPDLILSGINHGVNIGNDIWYSGTVAAAAEGAAVNIPSIAISQEYNSKSGEINWVNPQKFLKQIIEMLMNISFWNKSTVMNVNFPLMPAKGIKFTNQGKYVPCNEIEKNGDSNSNTSYTISRITPDKKNRSQCDGSIKAIDEGYITITPLKFDMTDFDILESLTSLNESYTI